MKVGDVLLAILIFKIHFAALFYVFKKASQTKTHFNLLRISQYVNKSRNKIFPDFFVRV